MKPFPVMLPLAERLVSEASHERLLGAPILRLRLAHGVVLLVLVLAGLAHAQSNGEAVESTLQVITRWMPLLLKGFGFNVLISVLAMGIGTAIGLMLGLFQVSHLVSLRRWSHWVTQFFRNAPWLVLLFLCMFLLPFEFNVGSMRVPFPDWIKAVMGLSLPVMANVSEIVRGAVQSIPSGQWEAAESLGYTRRQIMWTIILPQCVQRMLPPWMNLYAILTMATVLASIVGVSEMMTLAARVLAAENRADLLIPVYGFVLLCFFAYCYPIALLTRRLEHRFRTNT